MKIKLFSDSTCDLSQELIREYDIQIIPLHVIMDDFSYDDAVNLRPEQIYEWSDRTRQTPKTSAPSVGEIEKIMRPYLDDYDQFVLFSIASGMSSSNQSMRIAVSDLGIEDRSLVIDSQNLSTGIGLLIIKAAEMIMAGCDITEIEKTVNRLIPEVRSSFVVDTLTYLYRGGRCSGLASLAGAALKLHPLINVIDGKMVPGKKYRGNMNRIFRTYADDLKSQLADADKSRVFITHSGSDPDTIEAVRRKLQDEYDFKEILVTQAGCVISSHCGPNTLGVLFIANGGK